MSSNSSAIALLTATQLGEKLNLSRYKVNPVLADLGLLDKAEKGWLATRRALSMGAQQKVHSRSRNQYVIWPEEVLSNTFFIKAVRSLVDSPEPEAVETTDPSDFRKQFRNDAKYRTDDGHWVRSKAEALIDNWLYWAGLAHAYERRLPVEEEVYCDFYIRLGRVYVEYWGLEDNPRYAARKTQKQQIYAANDLNLIELTDEHIQHLDDYLPQALRKFNVPVN
ncbi:MAG: hypothetical protein F6K04_17675 [Leptolyngbya sp. SIO4C5]|nr:hypothetical protein [Leptolyngbya sp. SIO4C5]